ncbi:MAG: hypothetical protein QM758_05630 [Armatimonas sp.]
MNRRHFLSLALVLTGSGALTLTGCGGGGSKESAITTTLGGVTGFLFTDAGGNLVVGTSASPPPGTTPLAGTRVEIVDTSLGTSSGRDGGFTLHQIEAGLQRLRIQKSTGPVEIALTVVGNAIINTGTPTVTRSAAIEKARAALSAAGVTNVDAVTILSPQQPLPTGVLIVPRLDAPTIDASVPGAKTLAAPTWFFFCDEHAGQPFARKVRFVYIDAVTGAAETVEASSWPTFNAQHFYAIALRNATLPDLVQPGAYVAPPAGDSAAAKTGFDTDRSRAEDTTKVNGILLYGFGESYNVAVNDAPLPGHAGIPATLGISRGALVQTIPDGTNLRDVFLSKFQEVSDAAPPGDTLIVDINTHGNLDSKDVYYMALPAFDRGWYEGKRTLAREMVRPADIPLAACRACHLVLIVGTCFSGYWIDYAQSALDLPGKTISLFTASGKEEGWGELLSGRGMFASEAFREAIGQQDPDSGQDGLMAAFKIAKARSDEYMANSVLPRHPDAKQTTPQFWTRTPTEAESCQLALSPATADIGTTQILTMKITLNNRPAGSPPVTIKLATTLGQLSTSAGAGASITLTEPGTFAFESSAAGNAVVTAEAFEKVNGTDSSIGKVKATITVKPLTVSLTPAAANIAPGEFQDLTPKVENYKKVNDGDKIEFTWTNTATAGRLSQSSTDDTTNAGVTRYTANSDATGSDTVSVKATLVTTGGNRFELGSASATLTIKTTPYILDSFEADDYITVWLNGKIIYTEADGSTAHDPRGPFTLIGAKKGDKLRLQVRDYYGIYGGTKTDVYVIRPNGERKLWFKADIVQTPAGNKKIMTDHELTLD